MEFLCDIFSCVFTNIQLICSASITPSRPLKPSQISSIIRSHTSAIQPFLPSSLVHIPKGNKISLKTHPFGIKLCQLTTNQYQISYSRNQWRCETGQNSCINNDMICVLSLNYKCRTTKHNGPYSENEQMYGGVHWQASVALPIFPLSLNPMTMTHLCIRNIHGRDDVDWLGHSVFTGYDTTVPFPPIPIVNIV